MVSSFSYIPFMIRSRPPAHGTVPTLFRVRFHFLEMPALTHDKLCLPGSHPVRLKVDVYHYRILVNTNTLETIPIHPAYILRFRVFQFYGCFISISSKSWLPFLNSLLILPFLLISFISLGISLHLEILFLFNCFLLHWKSSLFLLSSSSSPLSFFWPSLGRAL